MDYNNWDLGTDEEYMDPAIVSVGEPAKRGRGRPRKEKTGTEVKRPRGRPRKEGTGEKTGTEPRKRGRPKGSKNLPRTLGQEIASYENQVRGRKIDHQASIKREIASRKKLNVSLANTSEEYEYNSRCILHAMKIQEIATHADLKDLDSLKECFIAYLQLCQEDGFRPGNMGAYTAMGMSKSLFEKWKASDKPDIKRFCNFVASTCAMIREGLVSDGKINPIIGIFWQRNFDGLRNDVEQLAAGSNDQVEQMTADDYRNKYSNLLKD